MERATQQDVSHVLYNVYYCDDTRSSKSKKMFFVCDNINIV